MNTKQIPTDVLKILIPDDSFDHDPDNDILDEARDQLADQLSGVADEDGLIDDPVMAALHRTLSGLRGIEKERRLLLAYAREFAPRRYPMEALASVAGMSASNVRYGKAYTDDDIAAVARRIGRSRPGPPADPEAAAIATFTELIDNSGTELKHQLLTHLDAERVRIMQPDLGDAACVRVINYLRDRYSTSTEPEN